MRDIEFTVKIKENAHINDAFDEAITLAKNINKSIHLNMDNFSLKIYPYSYIEDIKEKYHLKKEVFDINGGYVIQNNEFNE